MRTFLSLFCFCLFFSTGLKAQCLKNDNPGIHTVHKGETLYRIANLHNISVESLLLWNQMKVDDPLIICQDLYVAAYAVPARDDIDTREAIPTEFSERTAVTRITPTETTPARITTPTSNVEGRYIKQGGSRHTVKAGENIAGLADLYGYTEKRFRELNAISWDFDVTPGSVILSSDCACDRINYDDPTNYGYKEKTNKDNQDEAVTNYSDGSINPSVDRLITGGNTDVQPAREATPAGDGRTGMSSVELSMVDEINLMRSNPRGYVRIVQAYVADQKANNGFPIDDNVVNELLQDLKRSPALSNLQPLSCVYNAAQKHGQDILRMGDTNHQGSDGLWPWDRVKNACPNLTDGNENLVGGPESVRESVIILLIDEGIPGRGHRKTLMKPEWKFVACHKIGTVGQMPNCWVQKFGY